jgi:carbonic anhydrase/acetyltransferase-like protein (isoleucine patch superfamily)
MPIYSYKEFIPKIESSVYVAPSADIIGRVTLPLNVSVWHQCVLRADVNSIELGENTNVQDLSMLHVTKDYKLTIGKCVSIGHSVTLHGCTIGDHSLIGMGAIIMDGASVGEFSVVAGGRVIPPGKKYPPKSMIMGNPAVVKRELTLEEINLYSNHYKAYVRYRAEYLDGNIVKELPKNT